MANRIIQLKDDNDNKIYPLSYDDGNYIKKTDLQNMFNSLINTLYPVGSIYTSIDSTNPHSLFGGTWEQIKDTFLLSAGDTYVAGNTGGQASVTLNTNQIPSHNHTFPTSNNLKSGSQGYSSTHVNGTSGAGRTNTTGSTGGNAAHNNMPPYIAVYTWKRTA